MFKALQYRLWFNILLLVASVVATTWLIMEKQLLYCLFSGVVALVAVKNLFSTYRKFNRNFIFLLNAIENGDYSFDFVEAKGSTRDLTRTLNRIKDILSKARRETIENEKFQSLIVESVSTGIIILDQNNHILIANRVAAQLLGMPVLNHLNQLAQIDKSYPGLFETLKPGDVRQITITTDREEVQISLRLSEISIRRGVMRIISLNSIGNELEAKEMESWVRLIRVMTHEIMNSIAPITSLTDTLLTSYQNREGESPDSLLTGSVVEALQAIRDTAGGLTSFVESYRKFTGIPQPRLLPVDAVRLVNKTLALESSHLKVRNIEAEIVTTNGDWTLNADEAQITQVLVNLIKNAAEAIGQDGKIKIVLSGSNGKTIIDVCNNGQPVPDELLPNIFIPFFTTKESGTGIGLSVSRYIMRLHGGNLKHHANEGWTCFRLVF